MHLQMFTKLMLMLNALAQSAFYLEVLGDCGYACVVQRVATLRRTGMLMS